MATAGTLDIIVATSDHTTRTQVVSAVEALGHTVTSAADSAELLRLALRSSAQLALIDLELGPLGGVELVSLLRDMNDELLVVPMVDGSRTDTEFAVRSLGIFYYMLKPVDGAELRDVVESASRRAVAH